MLKGEQPDRSGRSPANNGRNLASVLNEIATRSPEQFGRINEFLDAVVPSTKVLASVRQDGRLEVNFQQEATTMEIHLPARSMSDGTVRIVALLAAAFQREIPTLLAIEEPETSLQFGAVAILMDVIGMAAIRTQVVVTTQSPEVLDSEFVTQDNLYVVTWFRGASTVTHLLSGVREALQTHLFSAGELLLANQLESEEASSNSVTLFRRIHAA